MKYILIIMILLLGVPAIASETMEGTPFSFVNGVSIGLDGLNAINKFDLGFGMLEGSVSSKAMEKGKYTKELSQTLKTQMGMLGIELGYATKKSTETSKNTSIGLSLGGLSYLSTNTNGKKESLLSANIKPSKTLAIEASVNRDKDNKSSLSYAPAKLKVSSEKTKDVRKTDISLGNISYSSMRDKDKYNTTLAMAPSKNLMITRSETETNRKTLVNYSPKGLDIDYLSDTTDTLQKTDIKVVTDPKAKYGAELNINQLSGDKNLDSKSLRIRAPFSDRFSLVGYYKDSTKDNKVDDNYNVGIAYKVTKSLNMTMSIDDKPDQEEKKLTIDGMVAKELAGIKDITISSSINTQVTNDKETKLDNAIKLQASLLNGTATLSNAEKLDTKSGIYRYSRAIQYESNPTSKIRFGHISKRLINPDGSLGVREENNIDIKTMGLTLGMRMYNGREEDGEIIPAYGDSFKILRTLSTRAIIYSEYNEDSIEGINRSLGFRLDYGKTFYEINYGRDSEYGDFFKVNINHRLGEYMLKLSGEKKGYSERARIKPEEGETLLKLDIGLAL